MTETRPNMYDKKAPPPIVAIIVIIAIIVVVLVVVGQRQNYKPVTKGSPSIDFTLPDIDEGKLHRLSDYRGKVVFLNFWATWCKPCEEEIPSMERLYRSLEGRDFVILALSTDTDPPEMVKEFTDNYGVTFTVLHDRHGKIKEAYKTTGFPETFIIDQNGMVAQKIVGPRDWDDAFNTMTIKALLENPPAPLKADAPKDSGT